MAESNPSPSTAAVPAPLPRIAIKYCTQCKWMLRAAYLAQELLSTFSTSLGEVSLLPSAGGVFTVTITSFQAGSSSGAAGASTETATLWDRKVDGGFPETKELKSRVRNVIDPSRDLGHVDRALRENKKQAEAKPAEETQGGKASSENVSGGKEGGGGCEDCGGK